jgi:hypothetical protein
MLVMCKSVLIEIELHSLLDKILTPYKFQSTYTNNNISTIQNKNRVNDIKPYMCWFVEKSV